MRTTLDLPTELLQGAKAAAALRGESLKEFLTRAVANALGSTAEPAKPTRVTLPLVRSRNAGVADITNEDIAAAFDAEDAERYGGR